ncbi:MAG: hypothetical protein NC200_07845, partial [Candidatus Gastranaerophilales bacterium]|nr:hypothetical protein [Candidatus Gastranaerophilales bacterium]
ETYPGIVNVRGAYDIIDGYIKLSTVDFRNVETNIVSRGFEVVGDGKVVLNIDKVHFVNARTENDIDPSSGETLHKGGSVFYIDNTDPETKITISDSVMEFNSSEGLGGAIYSTNDLTLIAEDINTILSGNKQLCSDINPNGTANDIYLAGNGIQTLNLITHNNNRIGFESGLEISENTKLILNINDNSENSGTVHIKLNNNLGSGIKPIAGVILNGGTFDLMDGNCTSIFTSNLTVNSDTDFVFDIDLVKEVSDQIYTTGVRNNTGSGRIILKPENFNFLSGQVAVDSVKFRLLNVYCATSKFMTFYDEFNPEGTNAVLLYSIFNEEDGANTDIYAKLGLNGSIIIGSSPDCGDDLLVKSIMSPKNQTYKLTENNVLFNYGTLRMQGDVQSKKLTIKGDGYSSISTPSELFGITLRGTDTIAASKQQFVGSKFTFKGFNGAVINQGGKVSLSSVNFLSNETDDNGSGIRNLSGTVSLSGAKKSYAQVFDNFATNNGGAIYNNGTLTLKYVQLGKSPEEDAVFNNYAYIGGALYNSYKATISNSNFEYNIGELCAGAIYSSAYTKLTSNNFQHNSSIDGGALYISAVPEKANTVTISKNNFYSNEAIENGGALYVDSGTVNISSSNFGSALQDNNGNTAQYGGAIYNTKLEEDNTSLTKVSSSKFAWNEADLGGAIYNEGNISLSKNSFGLSDKAKNKYLNTAQQGGAIYNGGVLTDSSSTFMYNDAVVSGGAIYNTGNILTYDKKGNISGGLNSSKFTENTSGIGGAIYNDGNIGFSKAVFTGNFAKEDGGAIYNDSEGIATIISATFRQNSATENGGAIYNNGTMYLNKSKIGDTGKKLTYANTAKSGAAIYNNGFLSVNGTTIAYNQAIDGDDIGMGTIYNTSNGVIDMISASLTGNKAQQGGAVYNTGTLTTDNKTKFTSNTADLGGAIYNASENLSLQGSSFSKNTAISGGVLYNAYGSIADISYYDYVTVSKGKEKHKYYNPAISSNTAVNGGAVYNLGTLTVSNASFSKNNANNNSSGLTSESKLNSGNGGAIYNDGELSVDTVTFSSNTAMTTITDVVSNDDGTKTTYSTTTSYGGKGGAIYNSSSEKLDIINSTFTSNKAGENGGAICNENQDSELNINGSTFKSNTSLNKVVTKEYSVNNSNNKKSSTKTTVNIYDENTKGGAIYTQGVVNINKNILTNYDVKSRKVTQFTSNSSYNGGAIYAENTMNISSATFTSNSAKGNGGAIYIGPETFVNIVNTDFAKNSAVKGGAIYVGQNTTLTLQDVSFTNNTATEA